jgi:POT family proton-dependent oligopeptide transporter
VTTDEFSKTCSWTPAGLFVLFFKMWERFSYMECVPYLFCFYRPSQKGLVMEYWRCHGFVWNLYYVGLFHPVIRGSLPGFFTWLLCGAWQWLWATHRWQLKRLFLYIGIGFLIIGNGLFKPNMTSYFERLS